MLQQRQGPAQLNLVLHRDRERASDRLGTETRRESLWTVGGRLSQAIAALKLEQRARIAPILAQMGGRKKKLSLLKFICSLHKNRIEFGDLCSPSRLAFFFSGVGWSRPGPGLARHAGLMALAARPGPGLSIHSIHPSIENGYYYLGVT